MNIDPIEKAKKDIWNGSSPIAQWLIHNLGMARVAFDEAGIKLLSPEEFKKELIHRLTVVIK